MSGKTSSTFQVENLADNLQKLSSLSMDLLTNSFQNNLKLMSEMGNVLTKPLSEQKHKSSCCPPEHSCPPDCLLKIERNAYSGEVIIIPFAVKNTCNATKTYKIGLRPLVDQDGNPAAQQPILSRQEVTLEPGQTIQVLLKADFSQRVDPGTCYQADIVIREKEVNQNICLKINITSFCDVPVAKPLSEEVYFNHWQGWESHFYCEKKPEKGRTKG